MYILNGFLISNITGNINHLIISLLTYLFHFNVLNENLIAVLNNLELSIELVVLYPLGRIMLTLIMILLL